MNTIQKIEIKKWQLDTNVLQMEIAKDAGVNQSTVSLVLNGKSRNQKVVKTFLSKGCPGQFFASEE